MATFIDLTASNDSDTEDCSRCHSSVVIDLLSSPERDAKATKTRSGSGPSKEKGHVSRGGSALNVQREIVPTRKNRRTNGARPAAGRGFSEESGPLIGSTSLGSGGEKTPLQDLTQAASPDQNDSDSIQCRICMDRVVQPTATECGHVFCYSCLLYTSEKQKNCPLCRSKFSIKKIRRLYI